MYYFCQRFTTHFATWRLYARICGLRFFVLFIVICVFSRRKREIPERRRCFTVTQLTIEWIPIRFSPCKRQKRQSQSQQNQQKNATQKSTTNTRTPTAKPTATSTDPPKQKQQQLMCLTAKGFQHHVTRRKETFPENMARNFPYVT